MGTLEDVIRRTVRRISRNPKLQNVTFSNNRESAGIELGSIDENELEEYLGELTDKAYFRGLPPPKESWHQLNGIMRPIVNAAVIELCKYLPYLPGLDKNNLYRAIGIKIGRDSTVAPRVQFDYFHPELIGIGDHCIIGDNVQIWTHMYDRKGDFMLGPVKIGDRVLVGANSVLGPCGIGDDVTINMGAFVYGNVPSGAKVRGRERSRFELT